MRYQLNILFLFFITFGVNAQNDSIHLKNLFDKAYSYEQSNPDSALVIYNDILTIAERRDEQIFIAKAYNYKGIVYSDMGKYDSAVANYKKSVSEFENLADERGIAANKINIGNTFQLKGNFSSSILYYLEGIAIYEKLEDAQRLSISLGNIATIFEDIGQYEDAKKNYAKSNQFAKKINDSVQLIYNYYNISNLYENEKKSDSAFLNIEKAKMYLNGSSGSHLKHLINYAEARYYLNTSDTKVALEKANTALKYAIKTNDPYYLALTHCLVGRIYFVLNKFNDASKHSLKALKIAEEHNNNSILIKIYGQLSDIYQKNGNHVEALNYKELEYEYRDIVLSEKQKNNINSLNIKYETEKKDKEIIQQQLQIEKKKTQSNFLVVISTFLFLISVLMWFLLQQKQKRKNEEIISLKREHQIKTLESLIEGEEKERFRIAKELHDGVNGDLSAIKFKLSSLLEMNNSAIKEIILMLDNSCTQVRAISHNLVPPSLENFNLLEAVAVYCELSEASHKEKISFQHLGDSINISKKEEINIFRIIQELVTNGIRHANATEINVQISCRDKNLQITVEDNGKGFDPNHLESKGIGLKNIQSRVSYLSATMDFISNKEGTSYTIEIDKDKIDEN